MLARFLGYVFGGSVAILLFSSIFIFGASIEAAVFPVIINQQATEVSREGNLVTFRIALDKVRDCRLVEQGYSLVMGDHRVPVDVFSPTGLAAKVRVSYPVGHFVTGPFNFKLPEGFEAADTVDAALYYDCHPGWLVRQTFGPVTIPKPGG